MNNQEPLSLQLTLFTKSLKEESVHYGLSLEADTILKLEQYFEILKNWNKRLHLIAPCAPEEFATRHILESLTALPYISKSSNIIDIGSGGGIPIIPILILRPDIEATLIEASAKKSIFLRETLNLLGLNQRAKIINERFERVSRFSAEAITCRALDQFADLFQTLLDWSTSIRTLILFGGPAILQQIERSRLNYQTVQMPNSAQRFLFVIERGEE
jgi:16S rRNA (guanine527-N7)-methyltransferase